jgi:6-phosphogluconolactonase (cycloisomerase 2 family)
LITNDDYTPQGIPDSASFFPIAADGTLGNPTQVNTSGTGAGGGYFAENRVVVLNNPAAPCVYLSAGFSNTIAGIEILTQTETGDFHASSTDNSVDNGIGMVVNSNYLYASFSSSSTIATFGVLPGCGLQFLSDISATGLNGGTPKGMALSPSGGLLVVTYGDGSIQSFNVSAGLPVSNGDEQNASGYENDNFPNGVVISPDGHWAIFGDDSSGAAVEVSDISSGQLGQTAVYNLPSGFNSNNVLLSPDATLLYITNNTSGQVTAAFFDITTGMVSGSCTSAPLNGFANTFGFSAAAATQLPAGTGSVLYVAENGGYPSTIGIINVSASGGTCTLTEAASSPAYDEYSPSLLSISVVSTVPPGLYSPASGSTLTGNTATFDWSAYSGATAYWLDVGAEQGGHEYYSSGSLPTTTLSQTVNSLPLNGSAVWARWYYLISGTWQHIDYSYAAFVVAGNAVMRSPTPGSTLSGSTVTFTWSAGTGTIGGYWVDIGSTAGAHDYYSSGNLGNVLTTTVNGLPANGSTMYVTLYTEINGTWGNNAYTYTAFSAGSAKAVMTSPVPGSTLSGSNVTFTWNAGTGASAYWIDIGSTAGAHDYYSSGNLGNVLTTTINGLPANGSTMYVTLYTEINGTWGDNAYTYTAFSAGSANAVMTSPVPGSTLSGSSVTFTWNAGTGASAYWIDIGSSAEAHDYYSSGSLGTALTTTANGLPTDGSTIYVTLYSQTDGAWSANTYTYSAFNSTSGLAAMVTPAPGATLSGNSVTFTWSADSVATGYWVDISLVGPGGNDLDSSGNLGAALTETIYNLPANGRTVYVTLYSYGGGQWLNNAYVYTSGP